jgi:branched-chain amino acid transport system substrate-binding protein
MLGRKIVYRKKRSDNSRVAKKIKGGLSMKQCNGRTKGLAVGLMLLLSLCVFFQVSEVRAADKVIQIGVIGPMKFSYGEQTLIGAQMAADKINAAGGVSVKGEKYKIVLHEADDNSFLSTSDAVSAMERLATVMKVKYIIGGFKTESVLAQQEVMADHKVIFLGSGSAHAEQCLKVGRNYNRYKYWFRVCPHQSDDVSRTYVAAAAPVLAALNAKLGITKPKVAILADKAQWADPGTEYAKTIFAKMGCEVVGVWRPSFTATSVSAELSAIKSAGAHMIFLLSSGPSGNVISRQWGELQIPAAMTGTNTEGARLVHWTQTDGKCNYAVTSNYVADVEMTKHTRAFYAEFVKRAKGEGPIHPGAGAYDAVNVLKEAIERANSLDVDPIISALEKTKHLGATGMVAFTPVGTNRPHDLIWGPNNTTFVSIQWRDGKQYVIWPDGKEIPPAVIASGAPSGWNKVKYSGSSEYVLPPWVIEYWKNKK